MNITEIPTPRTDKKVWAAFYHIDVGEIDVVDADFARQLERENAAMRAALQLAEASLGHLKQRDWFKEDVKNDVVCTLNADLVRLTLNKLKPYLP